MKPGNIYIAIVLLSLPRFLFPEATEATAEIQDYFQRHSVVLDSAEDLDPLLERVGDVRIVLLGEASHGTSEYYRWRAEISKRLITEKGFNIIVVEGDWPSCYEVNRYIKGLPGAPATANEALGHFKRWPTWMWSNHEILDFVEWLKLHNDQNESRPAGFYGMDIYAMPDSINAVLDYVRESLPEDAESFAEKYRLLSVFRDDPQSYARYTVQTSRDAAEQTRNALARLHEARERLEEKDSKAFFNAEQNALAVKSAEKHYRAMAVPELNSWNKRVEHMDMTVRRLLEYHGQDAKVVVWAHNTHIGDARATAMTRQGMKNIGQLSREHFGLDEVVAVGFGTYEGAVIAGTRWGAPSQEMKVPPAMENSVEEIMNRLEHDCFMILFDRDNIPPALRRPLGHRAKGVVYDFRRETGNYVPTIMPLRYDAFIFIRSTSALNPL